MILNEVLLYKYNDAAYNFVNNLTRYNEKTFFVEGESHNIFIDMLSTVANNFFAQFIPPILLNNLFVVLFTVLSLFFSYKLFKQLSKSVVAGIMFSVLYSTSIYQMFRIMSATYALYSIFIFPLLVWLLYRKIKYQYVGVVVFAAFLISNYYGFFAFVTTVLWILLDFTKAEVKNAVLNLSKFGVVFAVLLALVFGAYIPKNLAINENYSDDTVLEGTIYRPIEDYYSFSFRPWYFFIPPKSSVFFGEFSNGLYQKISETGYFLANSYEEEEMAGSYLGWHFILGSMFVFVLLVLKKIRKGELSAFDMVYANSSLIWKCFGLILLILFISMPPSFTVGGVQIFTPSYLLYFVAPMFRVLTRWASVIYLLTLVINVFLYVDLFRMTRGHMWKGLAVLGFLILNFVVFAVRLDVKDLKHPPEEIVYIKEMELDRTIKVFPKTDYYSTFWSLVHNNQIDESLNKTYTNNCIKVFYSNTPDENNDNSDNFVNRSRNINLPFLKNNFIKINSVKSHEYATIIKNE